MSFHAAFYQSFANNCNFVWKLLQLRYNIARSEALCNVLFIRWFRNIFVEEFQKYFSESYL
jgi:hypothetical protein